MGVPACMKAANPAKSLTRGGQPGAHRETKQSLGLVCRKVKGWWRRTEGCGSKPAVSV
jgi:hypothetical protein